MKKLLNTSFGYMIAGLAAGVFYREFTKFTGLWARPPWVCCIRIC